MNPDPAAAASPATLTDATIGIVVSDRHSELTNAMLEACIATLKQCGVENEDIFVSHVPSVMELMFAARQMSVVQEPKAVIMLGCCIEEEDPQFWIVRESHARAYVELNLHSDIPYINGVLLPSTLAEAQVSVTAQKGSECAEKVSRMVNMMANLVII